MEMEEWGGGVGGRSILKSRNISLTKYGEQMRGEGRGQGLNECTFMLLCYDMNSERVIIALNVYMRNLKGTCMYACLTTRP